MTALISFLSLPAVRYSPWFPNPRVVVTELTPSDCTKDKPATNWNSTLMDQIVRDFMAAVCGPDAINGACEKSVVQQLSTMPSYYDMCKAAISALKERGGSSSPAIKKVSGF